jgi:uncharacterized protein YqeY
MRAGEAFRADSETRSGWPECSLFERPMKTFTDIHEDLKGAMKAGDAVRRDTLRMLESALRNEAIELRKETDALTSEEVMTVVRRLVKQRREAASEYRQGDREELATKEDTERELLEAYLPAGLSDDELRAIVAEAKESCGATSKADFGRLMGVAVQKVAGRADGNQVKTVVEEMLSE